MNNSSEKIARSPETEAPSREALEQAGHERREQLHDNLERASKESSPENVEGLHETALEHAESTESQQDKSHDASPERHHRGPISRAERDASFSATMQEVRTHMSAPSRNFSKIIHNKTIEKVSEAAGSTIARPNAILSGAVAAFIVTLAVYLVAKNYGYPLSGFESIGAFIVGWVIGLTYDYLRIMITGKKA